MKAILKNIFQKEGIFIVIALLILSVFLNYKLAIVFIPIVLIYSYYQIIKNNDFSFVLILMLLARTIMGLVFPKNTLSFDVLNFIVNYLPFIIYIFKNLTLDKTIILSNVKSIKLTVIYAAALIVLSLVNVKISYTEWPEEVFPILMFVVLFSQIKPKDLNIDLNTLVKFFRYTFSITIGLYLLANFNDLQRFVLQEGIIFSIPIPHLSTTIANILIRNMGFVFDFRILGQIAIVYYLLIFFLKKKYNLFDVLLITSVILTTYSRGPLIIFVLVLIPVFLKKENYKLNNLKYLAIIIPILFFKVFNPHNPGGMGDTNYLSSFDVTAKKNAISQRGEFMKYSFDKFLEQPMGRGIGAMSSKNADNDIHFYDKGKLLVTYHSVTDAYYTLSLAEKGVLGFFLFFLSCYEVFFDKKHLMSFFVALGFAINMVGTDIPKEGFFYFVIIVIIYYLNKKSYEITY
ncbi:O-antigen ligase family protein [Vicingaceae bacterium]|nr:O-antigen ligase family protein [Vicingaceae bacterium]